MKYDIQTLEHIYKLLTKENSSNVKHFVMPLLKFVIWSFKEEIGKVSKELNNDTV